jgi:hypothetical protein
MIQFIPIYHSSEEYTVQTDELKNMPQRLANLLLDKHGEVADSVLIKMDGRLILCEKSSPKEYVRIELTYHPLQNLFT